jgi:hypothetical protein
MPALEAMPDEVGDGPAEAEGDCLQLEEDDQLIDEARLDHIRTIGNRW